MCVVYFCLGVCLLLFVGFLFALGLVFFVCWIGWVCFGVFLISEGEDRGDANPELEDFLIPRKLHPFAAGEFFYNKK